MLVDLISGTVLAAKKHLKVTVDPRIELLSVVQLLSGYNQRSILTRHQLGYKEEIYEYFDDYKDHKAVKQFTKMSEVGFSYDAPPAAMLYLSNPPELEIDKPFTKYLKRRAGNFIGLFGEQRLNSFVENLADFAQDSDFMTFYNDHQEFYNQIITRTRETIAGEDYIKDLEDYYGMEQASYNVILVPLFHPGGYGPRVARDDNRFDIYNIRGPIQVRNGLPYFGSQDQFQYLAWHEFGHSFVNPLTSKYSEEVNEYKSLYEPIEKQMKSHAYGSWETTVNEHIVRAITTRLTYIHRGQKLGDSIKKQERTRGFVYIDALMEKLEEFESSREKYPTFEDFYPELIKVFEELSNQKLSDEFYSFPYRGNINKATTKSGNIALIIPTNEKDEEIEKKIHKYVKAINKMFFKDSPILTDKEALEKDMSKYTPIVYGTVEGNLWLKKYIDYLPVMVDENGIEIYEEYQGSNMKLITVWTNPLNSDNGMVIYTAQQAEDILNINDTYHGPTDFVVCQGNAVVEAGHYKK